MEYYPFRYLDTWSKLPYIDQKVPVFEKLEALVVIVTLTKTPGSKHTVHVSRISSKKLRSLQLLLLASIVKFMQSILTIVAAQVHFPCIGNLYKYNLTGNVLL